MTSTVTPAKTMVMRSAAILSAVVMAIVMAGCSSGPTPHASTSTSVTEDHRIDEHHHHHIEPSKRNTDSGPERVGVRRANPLRLPPRILAAGSG